MSLATWKEEFYRQDARAVPKDRALAHSFRKWIGLLPKAMKKHGVRKFVGHITDGEEWMSMNCASCALCTHYEPPFCDGCPISKETDKCSLGSGKPWNAYSYYGLPRPMLRVLHAAYEAEYAARKEKR